MNRRTTRSSKILSMLQEVPDNRSREILDRLNIPVYESTKGIDTHARNLAVTLFKTHEIQEKNKNEGTAIIEDLPATPKRFVDYKNPQDSAVSSTSKRNCPETRSKAFKVKRQLVSSMLNENVQPVTSKLCSLEIPDVISSTANSDSELFEHSGDEYVPSSCDSSSDSSAEILSEEEITLPNKKTKKSNINSGGSWSLTTKGLPIDRKTSSKENGKQKQKTVTSTANINAQSSRETRDMASGSNEGLELVERNQDENLIGNSINEPEIPYVKKNDSGKRIRNKTHSCYICNKILSNNMARHFERVHGGEIEVAKVLAMPKGSKRRREAFEYLIRVGDFYYNCNVLSTKQGELILVRRPEAEGIHSYGDFGPCSNCLGFFLKKYLWHHLKFGCKATTYRPSDCPRKSPLNESSALLFQIIGSSTGAEFQKHIVATFRSDKISAMCKEDDLILNLGGFLFEKYGLSQIELIRQSMRQLGRLKCQLQELDGNCIHLKDFIIPAEFDKVVLATKTLCGTTYNATDKRNEFGIPSLALKIGYLLRKCVAIEKGIALKKCNFKQSKILESFTTLMDMEWSARISSNALLTMHKRKINSKQLLPLTSDLLKLNMYLKNQTENLKNQVLSSCNRYIWSTLASITLCRIILFNKRRSGEASKMTVQHYMTRPSWSDQGTEELKSSLTPMEKDLATKLTVVEIIGKRNRKVPVILTNEIKNCIDILIRTRREGEVSPENHYMFARSQASQLNGHLRGHDCLRKECSNAGLASAENITSTKLRKYVATVCQIFDLKEHECDWLARHLGHDIRVHRDFYRMHESAVELTKVSRLLLAVDSGKAQRFSGKKLEDINVDDLSEMEPDDTDNEESEEVELEEVKRNMQDNELSGLPVEQTDEFPQHISSHHQRRVSSAKKSSVKKPWSSEEKQLVLKCFGSLIKHHSLPGKTACEDCISNNSILEGRKWTDIKFCIKNHLTKINKIKEK